MGNAPQAPATAEGPTQHTQNRAELVRATPAAAPAPRSQALSLTAMSVQDAWGFAKALADSKILPRQYQNEPGSVLWALEFGRGLGLDVITTIQSVHIIQNKATMSADLMASLTRRAGHRMRVSGDETNAKVVIFRADDPEFPFEVTWTMERAKQAQLTNKDTWKQYPAAMLRARAISECVRMACPEVLHGAIYTPEERGAAIDEDGVPLENSPRPAPQPAQYTVTQDRPASVPQEESGSEQHGAAEEQPAQQEASDEPLEALLVKVKADWRNKPAMEQNLLEAEKLGVLDVVVPVGKQSMEIGDLIQQRITALEAAQQERNAA